MRLFSLLLIAISFLGSSVVSSATDGESFDYEMAEGSIEAIEHAMAVLQKGSGKSFRCDLQKQRQCSLGSQCETLAGRSEDIYLYENSEGRRIPNFALYEVYNSLDHCMRSEKPQTLNEDPFLYPEKFSSAKNLKKWKAESGRMNGLFKETQDRLLKILTLRKDGKNDAQIEAMIQKVRTVKMNIPDIQKDWEELSGEGCETPNAFYDPYVHSMTICPQIVNFPDASLMSVIAHEIAHSIDPCHCAQDLVKTSDGYRVDFAFDPQGAKFLKPDPKAVVKGLGVKENPLASVISCLSSSNSMGVPMPTAKELQKSIGEDLAQMKKEGFTDKDEMVKGAKEMRARIPQVYDRYAGCAFITQDGRLGEAFADWASAQVLADKVKDIPDAAQARRFTFESQSYFMSMSCPGLRQVVQDKAAKLLDGSSNVVCRNAFMDFDALREGNATHPPEEHRMDKILYAQPELQRALGCKPGKAPVCQ